MHRAVNGQQLPVLHAISLGTGYMTQASRHPVAFISIPGGRSLRPVQIRGSFVERVDLNSPS